MTTQWDLLDPETRAKLDGTRHGGQCGFCSIALPTQGHVARHFVLYEPELYQQHGYCPKDLQKREVSRGSSESGGSGRRGTPPADAPSVFT